MPPTSVQSSRVRTWQVPFAKQQAPAGCTHGLGLQTVALPWKNSSGATHCQAARIKHVPFGEQHAPGSGQGLVVQVPPGVQTPSAHLASSVMAQLPSVMQQTPGGTTRGQEFGSQTVNSACQIVSGSTHRNSAISAQ
jgi:hypothetical protein